MAKTQTTPKRSPRGGGVEIPAQKDLHWQKSL